MGNYTFYQLDVFTDAPFTGNPLAVFPEADGIPEDKMQQISNEMNLSETVFVLPSSKALRRLRIFTPKQELPLAGHPVVGTWNMLARLGVTPHIDDGTIEIEHEIKLGVLPVEIEFKNGEPYRVTMTQGKWQTSARVTDQTSIARLATGLGLDISDINIDKNLPIEVVSTGIKAIDIPICTLEALGRIRVNTSELADAYLQHGAVGCYAFTFETKEPDSFVHARFFAPNDNILEDPATGSAAGSLSGYLAQHGVLKENSFVIEQGDFMNRPSRIFAEVTGRPGNIERVKIGGSSVVVAKGEIYL
ncbi:MAG TPA: PhzF family phenazine biosynthesis protein [Pyrinomonadaceae bacterium]|nr:PhzF family phenazine biosynthesis protein [Pyrinomonadaceae bacterium]